MARGNRRENIFFNDDDRRFFLKTLGDACERTGWKAHSWVLMNNHYHLLLETPEANLVEGMKWLQNAYTRRLNAKHRLWGRVFGDRYKAVLVEGGNRDYFTTLLDYIHLNPARAGAVNVAGGGSVLDYPWSSLRWTYANPQPHQLPWSCDAMGLEAFGLENTVPGRREFVDRLDLRAREEAESAGRVLPPPGIDARLSHLRRGWYWGSREFAEKAMDLAKDLIGSRKNATYRSGSLRHAHDLDEAERIFHEGLALLGLKEAELENLPGADIRKVVVAEAIRNKTTVRQQWIADRLKMGSASNVSQQLRRRDAMHGKKKAVFQEMKDKLSRIFD